ncbi:MAG: hypothetical protein [Caudoviricetes sp.]|nr:MAG: hypothetical protein [Caudoviricetes sp.]
MTSNFRCWSKCIGNFAKNANFNHHLLNAPNRTARTIRHIPAITQPIIVLAKNPATANNIKPEIKSSSGITAAIFLKTKIIFVIFIDFFWTPSRKRLFAIYLIPIRISKPILRLTNCINQGINNINFC